MNCSKCGSQLGADDRFCGECGQPVVPPAAPSFAPMGPPPQPARSKGGGCVMITLLILLLMLLACGGAIAGAFYYWQQQPDPIFDQPWESYPLVPSPNIPSDSNLFHDQTVIRSDDSSSVPLGLPDFPPPAPVPGPFETPDGSIPPPPVPSKEDIPPLAPGDQPVPSN